MDADFPILAAIAAHPAYPYQLLDHLNALGVKMARSTVYRRVEGLREAGMLEFTVDVKKGGQAKQSLALTGAGRELACSLALDALRREPLESPIFALALTAAERLDPAVLPAILRLRAAGAARKLTDEERQAAPAESLASFARERRIAHLRADVEWLQSVLLPRDEASQPAPSRRKPRHAG